MKHEKTKRIRTHQVRSTAWDEESYASDSPSVIARALLQRISKHKKDWKSPVIIHCEDGVAKTGC